MSRFSQAAATMHTLSLAAMEEASRLGVHDADIDHLLLALTLDADTGGQVLRRAGIRLDTARAAVEAGFGALIVAGNEAGGWASEESSFILLQALLAHDVPPIWVRGGIGPRSASACVAAGAAGVVLDGALLLAKESALGPAAIPVTRVAGCRPSRKPTRLRRLAELTSPPEAAPDALPGA